MTSFVMLQNNNDHIEVVIHRTSFVMLQQNNDDIEVVLNVKRNV